MAAVAVFGRRNSGRVKPQKYGSNPQIISNFEFLPTLHIFGYFNNIPPFR
jgi:hypothetical protein